MYSYEETHGLKMRMSTAGEIEDTAVGVTRRGGGTQHYIVPPEEVTGWEEIGSLEEFLRSDSRRVKIAR